MSKSKFAPPKQEAYQCAQILAFFQGGVLDLSNQRLGTRGPTVVLALCEALKSTMGLTCLNLRNNSFSASTLVYLAAAIPLCAGHSIEIDWSGNGVDQEVLVVSRLLNSVTAYSVVYLAKHGDLSMIFSHRVSQRCVRLR